MLRSIDEISGYTILALDGDIGRCQDFLFDDRSWVVRYMVARTARWLPGREVIVSPVFLQEPDWSSRQFPVRLTREQLEQAPPLEEHAPVSRQYEIDYHQYFALPFYWIGNDLWGTYPDPAGVIHPVERISPPASEAQPVEEGHLRSTAEVTGYHIATTTGDLGHVDDFLVDDETWALRYLVVDTRNWLPGRKVLVSPRWIDSIQWANEKVYVNLDSEAVKDSPEFDPSQPVNRRYEIELYDYYGRPHYWK
jgi:hypothetical protein